MRRLARRWRRLGARGRVLASLAAAYLVLLHVYVAASLFAPEVIDDQRWRWSALQSSPLGLSEDLTDYFAAQDTQAGPGRVVFVGDSHCHRFDAASLKMDALQFCAGGMTLDYAARELPALEAVSAAGELVVWAGVNDLLHGRTSQEVTASMQALLQKTSGVGRHVIILVPPVGASRGEALAAAIEQANAGFAELCREDCILIDTHAVLADSEGYLAPAYDAGDGLHLGPRGYKKLGLAIGAALAEGGE